MTFQKSSYNKIFCASLVVNNLRSCDELLKFGLTFSLLLDWFSMKLNFDTRNVISVD